jgi:hypothetical protein
MQLAKTGLEKMFLMTLSPSHQKSVIGAFVEYDSMMMSLWDHLGTSGSSLI